jgi:replicative DNA helicase
MAKSTNTVDRLPPYDNDAERAVLACVLLDPANGMAECLLKLRSGSEMFYSVPNQNIYEALIYLYTHAKPIDLVLLAEHLRTARTLENCGGLDYLMNLPDAAPSAVNLPEYLDIIQRKYLLRKVIQTCTKAVQGAYGVNGEAREFLGKFESAALAIRGSIEPLSGFLDIKLVQNDLIREYDEAQTKSRPMGLSSGFPDLDRVSGGMMEQEMIVLAGSRSTGKTSLALCIGYNVARAGTGVGIISLETAGKKVVHRMACAAGHVDGSHLFRGITTAQEGERMQLGFKKVRACSDHLFISDAGPLTGEQVCAICRRMHQKGARFFVIDYLQLIHSQLTKEYDRATQTSQIVKSITKELNCPVLVLSSLNRDSDKEQRRPRLSDLRNSGQIEYDADKVFLLWSDPKDREQDAREVVLDVAKNKDGPTGECKLMFITAQFRMESAARINDQDVYQQEFIDAPKGPHNDP